MKSNSYDDTKAPQKGLVWGCLRINPPAGFKVGMSEENTNENLFIFNFVKKPLDVWSNFSNFLVTNMKYYSKIWIVQILGRVLGKFGLNSQFAPWNRESDPITPFQCKVPRSYSYALTYRIRAYRTPLSIRTPGDTFWAHIGHFRRKIVEKR